MLLLASLLIPLDVHILLFIVSFSLRGRCVFLVDLDLKGERQLLQSQVLANILKLFSMCPGWKCGPLLVLF